MMDDNNLMALEAEIVKTLKTIYDPEIPVNIYDLGLIYAIDVDEENRVEVKMTLTAPNCPMADQLLNEVHQKTNAIQDVQEAKIKLVFDPPWDKTMMSEEAMLELGLL
ncbi:MAG: iron-sulfur cluster assembly protein [Bacteroidales bacterium]|jgi:FeS assembly SUF system protein|nr:iron-sulfur cluster assembly protein [Bacteroidales bacterium]